MKVCEKCGTEIDGKDGVDNLCPKCENKKKASKRASAQRKARDELMRDHGMTRVKGNLGGTYYE